MERSIASSIRRCSQSSSNRLSYSDGEKFSPSRNVEHKVEELQEKFRGLDTIPLNSRRASSITHILGGMLINSSRPLGCCWSEASTEAERQAICC